MNTQDKDLVVNTENAPNFSMFYNALKAAGLTATYKGPGPFTIFAPTDEAFKKLPDGALHKLLRDRPKLAGILNLHAIKGHLLAQDMTPHESPSMQGETLTFVGNDEGFTVNGARASRGEIEASNGVIHAIDTVLMPKS
jgi:uncharacterized surface protein with fasciclin (FAS1) repeats